MRRAFKWIVALGILGAIGWVGYKWYSEQGISGDALSFIPPDAIYYITTDDPIESWREISSSAAWTHLQKNSYFSGLTASANSLDSLIRENDLLFDLIGSRALVVSAHMTGPRDYDFLFLVDLKEVSGIKFIKDYLSGFSAADYSVKKEKYGDDDLIILHDQSKKNNLYLTLPGAYLLASYNKKIITSALDLQKADSTEGEEPLVKLETEEGSNGILSLFINYERLPQFMTAYTTGSNEYVNRLGQALQTTSLNVTLEEELIKATGRTLLTDSVESYLKTLSVSGEAATEFMEIAPQRTGFCLGLGFTTFREFFANFEKNIQRDITEYNSYKANLKQAEDYLGISLQENFINWIGDEVALLELQSSGAGLDNETAIIFKAENIEKAKKDLAHIEKMVRKKTPVKFKAVDHRGYTINYLSMKGLFKLLLGKFFARYDKPYYTLINNFVIFSNHPQTLKSMIDDYLDKNTLIRSEEFRDFRREFEDEGSVFVYLNTPVLFNSMKKLADKETRVSMENNKEYIVCFRQAGFQLVPEENGFNTLFAEQFVEPIPAPVLYADTTASDTITADRKAVVEVSPSPKDSDPMALPYMYVQNLNASTYSGYYPDSTKRFEVELKNGFKEGSFTEYYRNGEVKMKGHFRQDKRDGTWRLFDENGKLMMRRVYEDDEIKKEKTQD